MKTVYLGLGSNMGERETHMQQAIDALGARDLRFLRASGLYETEPLELREQPWFLNQVAEFETELLPLQLLHRILRIERELGRKRSVLYGPRIIDIDILLYGSAIVKTAELEIPHPRYRERRFVLEPLAELNPAIRDPQTKQTVAAMLASLHGQSVKRQQ